MSENGVKVWIARDDDGSLYLYRERPRRHLPRNETLWEYESSGPRFPIRDRFVDVEPGRCRAYRLVEEAPE